MAEDQRITALADLVRDAQDAVSQLDETQKAQFPEAFEQLEAALAYTSVALERTDGALVSETTHQQFAQTLGEVINNPQAVAAQPGSYAHTLLDLVSRLPVAKERELEQSVRDAAANFRRSASQHLNALSGEISETRQRLEELSGEITSKQDEAQTQVRELSSGFETRLSEVEASVNSARGQIDQAASSQAEAFEQQQGSRDEQAASRLDEVERSARERTDTVVEDLERMREETGAVVGAVGIAVTAKHYEDDAHRNRTTFWILFGVTVAILLGAVAAAVWATARPQPDVERFIGKLAISVALGALATYTATQARHYRGREQRSRELELELKIFGPFIEPLPPREKIRERIVMARKTFGRHALTSEEGEGRVELLTSDEELDGEEP